MRSFRTFFACSFLSVMTLIADTVCEFFFATAKAFEPTVEFSCKAVFAAAMQAKNSYKCFISAVSKSVSHACHGFIGLLKSLDQSRISFS